MNEVFFFLHILLVALFLYFSLYFGKNTLITFISLNAVLANFFIVKQINLFSLNVTASDVFSIGSIWGLNLLQEYYGKKAAKKAAIVALFSLVFFVAMSKVHLLYLPSAVDTTHFSFANIFSSSFRIVFSSIVVFYLVQKIDIQIFSLFKKKISLPVRLFVCLMISQAIDTILFSFFGLYGIVHSIIPIIFFSYLIKIVVILTTIPFNLFIRKKDLNEQFF